MPRHLKPNVLARLRHHRLRVRLAFEATHAAPQYCLGYALAFVEAGATEVDTFYMDGLLLQARRLARRPIRAVRLERWLWRAVWATGLVGFTLILQTIL